MQSYQVRLESPISTSFRCTMAANSLDIDIEKKSIHELNIKADINSDYSIGLIVGASGSGKTTLAKQIFGVDCFNVDLNPDLPIIDQLPKQFSYDECANILSGIGLTSVPCWIRPVKTLSNGQKARAEAALSMVKSDQIVLIDEWTSVVDRTVAKVMSHCVQKFARKQQKKIILLSCHYDVLEWLNPDWVIDCNSQNFIDRRLLQPEDRARSEKLIFNIREIDKSSWKYFSKYHYLSSKLASGKLFTFGLFHGDNQIGFQAFSNYVPKKHPDEPFMMHFNRTVVHPDYAGMGLGIHLINETSKIMHSRGFRIMGKFSSQPVFKALSKSKLWKLKTIERNIGKHKMTSLGRKDKGFRMNVKTYSFEFLGQ